MIVEANKGGLEAYGEDGTARQSRPRSVMKMVRAWLLLIPLVFLAVHGQPSFMQGEHNMEGGEGLAAAAEGGSGGDEGLERTFVYVAYGVAACFCLRDPRRIVETARMAQPLLWLAGLALCSALWSQVPVNSLRYACCYGMDTLLAICLVTVFTLEELMQLLKMAGVAVVVCSAVMVLAFPQFGIVHQLDHAGAWQGIFSEKNDAAKNLMFLLTPVMGTQFFERRNLLYAALLLPFIAMSGSESALVALLLMAVFVVYQAAFRRLSGKSATFAATLTAVAMTTGLWALVVEWTQITAMLGRDATLTGRTEIWALLLEAGRERPWLGYGYQAFWTGLEGESGKIYETLHWVFTYAHNGLLEVWLQLGWVGLALVIFALTQALRNAARLMRGEGTEGAQWLLSLLALTLLYNLDEGTILFTRSLVSMLFVLMYVGLAKTAAPQRVLAARRAGAMGRVAHA